MTDDYLKIFVLGERRYVYIYKVKPVIVINSENYTKTDIVSKFEEFLRGLNIDFQIIVETKEIEVRDYFEMNYINEDEVKNKMMVEYVKNLEKMFESSKIYVTYYYLIITSINKVENVENYFKIFNETELVLKKITSKNEMEEIIRKGVIGY